MLRPISPEHPDDETFDGLLIIRPEGRLFFLNAQTVADQIWSLVAAKEPRVVALDMSAVPDVEYSALKMMHDGLNLSRERGVTFWLVGLNPEALEMVRRVGLDAELGPDRLLFDARTAIDRFEHFRGAA